MRAVHDELQDGGLPAFDARLEGVPDVLHPVHAHPLGAHGLRHGDEALRVGDVHAAEAVVVEVDLVLRLGAPPHVPEHAGHDGEVVLDGRADLVEAHPPGAVADDGDDRRLRPGQLRPQGGGIGESRVPEGEGRDVPAAAVELQVAVRRGGDVPDVRGNDGVVRQGPGDLQEDAPRVDRLPLDHGGLHDLLLPGVPLLLHGGEAARVRLAVFVSTLETLQDLDGRLPGVPDDAHLDGMGAGDVLRIDVHLDDLRLVGEVVDVVLGQRAEHGEPGPHGEDHVRLREDPHGRLGAHVADGADGERMIAVEGVVVEVGDRHGRRQVLGDVFDDVQGIGVDDAPAGDDDGILRLRQESRCPVEARHGAAAPGVHAVLGGLEDGLLDLAVEIVPGDVVQDGAPLGVGDPEGRAQAVRRPLRMGHPHRRLGDGLEDRHLVALLEAVPADGRRPRRGGDDDQGRVAHVGRGHGRHHVRDAGPVLAGDDSGPAGDPRVGVFHVTRALLVPDGDEPDPRRREQIQHVHEGRSHDPAHVIDTLRQQRLDDRLAGRHFYLFHRQTSVSRCFVSIFQRLPERAVAVRLLTFHRRTRGPLRCPGQSTAPRPWG